ncbi:MFS transporter [Paracraurococcus lichenis]|uniref:MFS transporter n=1 Tax=Paracraurococcus lichenis TaxID=3064888 RepID=A0ABT9DYV9_9PROT|nr:MFS transporter [Paracraurococcus sp. LOR1-02]MDO9709089.1 MFS transporter [Paracraurococcus sp. LOR1-02]
MPLNETMPALASEAEPAAPPARSPFLTVFPSIVLPMFLAIVDQTIVSTALPAIGASLGGVERLSWIVVAYLVANTIAAPVYGRLGDALGRPRLMLAGLALFLLASLLCAVSTSVEMLAAMRVLQGLGGGGLMTLSQALVGESVPPRERGRYQGYLAGVMVCSSTFGPVAGGFLTQHLGWRSVFLVNLPIGLVAALLLLRLPRRRTGGGRIRFDTIGLGLFIGFVAPMLLALEAVQRFDPLSLATAAGLLAVSLLALLLLLRQERRATSPLLPVALLRQAPIWRADAMAACHGAALVSLFTFLPIYMRVVRGTSAAETGLLLLPLTIAIGVSSMVTGRLVTRTGRTAIFPSVGLCLATAVLVALGLWAPALGTREIAWGFGLNALGMGTVMGVVQITVQGAAGPKMLGAAAGSVQFSRSVGAAFGTALVGAVLFATLTLQGGGAAALFVDLIRLGPDALAGVPAAQQAQLQAGIAQAFSLAFLVVAAFTGCGALLAWSMPLRRI